MIFTDNIWKERFSLFARTLEASLEMTLLKLMGLYWVIFVGFFTFGMSTIWVSLKLGGIIPKFKKSSTALVTHSPDKDQKC